MKTIIVYYSFTNNNEILAKHLQEKLQCDLLKIETVRPRNSFSILLDLMFNRRSKIKPHAKSLKEYDHCIFLSPIWAGRISSPLLSFLLQEKDNINRYSFITVCGGGNADQKGKLTDDMAKVLQRMPVFVQELWINDLLTEEKKNTIKYTSGYRLQEKDLALFSTKLEEFLQQISPASATKPKETQHA
ncbi:MAG TPA: hypothetical protein VGD31_07585 [Sphingobacteriaceae bacterium]